MVTQCQWTNSNLVRILFVVPVVHRHFVVPNLNLGSFYYGAGKGGDSSDIALWSGHASTTLRSPILLKGTTASHVCPT